MKFLGKEVKQVKASKWQVVESSVKTISTAMLKKVQSIEVRQSEYNEEDLYALVTLDAGCTTFKLDRKFRGSEGDLIDPKTFKVFDRINVETGVTISRAFGKTL